MIERLKDMIDASEDNPKIKAVLLSVAELPESKQEAMLELMILVLNNLEKK